VGGWVGWLISLFLLQGKYFTGVVTTLVAGKKALGS